MAPKYYDIADMFQEILVPRDVEKDIVDAYCSAEKMDRALFFIEVFPVLSFQSNLTLSANSCIHVYNMLKSHLISH